MGRTISAGIDALDQPVNLTSEAAVVAGDLVKVSNGGWVRKVSDAFPLAAQNSAQGVTALVVANTLNGYGVAGNTDPLFYRNVLGLANGGYVLATSGNGTTTSTGVSLAFVGPSNLVQSRTVLSAAASIGSARLTRAGADNGMMAWSEGTSLFMAVVNLSTGAIVQAATAVGTVVASGANWNLSTLANGDVVIGYPSSTNMVFKRYNSAGVIQGVETLVEAAQDPVYITVLPLAAGGFVLRWGKTTATNGQRMARFNAAGVIQGAVVAINTGASLYDGGGSSPAFLGSMEGKLIEVANGNIISTAASSTGAQEVKVYDASLTLLTTVSLGATSAGQQGIVQIAAKFGGGFWLSCAAISNAVHEYSNAGLLLRASPTNMAGNAPRIIDRPGNGPLVSTITHTTSTSSGLSLFAMLPDLSARESNTGLLVYTSGSQGLSSVWQEVMESGFLVSACVVNTGAIAVSMSLAGAHSVVGVAQAPAAVGQSVKVSTAGKFVMNQTLTAPAFDRRASSPPGTKGSTIANTAILVGFVD